MHRRASDTVQSGSVEKKRLVGGIGRIALVIAFALLAVLAGVSAFQMSVARAYPGAASSLWPANGWAKLVEARRYMELATEGETAGQFPTVTDPRFVKLSEQALKAEPLAADAVRNLGLFYAGQGDQDRARKLMREASSLTRRDALLNLWLSQDYALQGDEPNALRHYDYLLRTNTRSRAATLPVLAQNLSGENAPEAYYRMLASDPPWHNDFWASVIQDGTALENASELRSRLHGDDLNIVPLHDSLLLAQLVRAGLMSEAFALFETVAEGEDRAEGQMLRDAEFNFKPQFAPFEWREVAEADYGSNIDAIAGVLQINALEGADGVVTQQLVRLAPGHYVASIDAANRGGGPVEDANQFKLRLACAEMLGSRTFDQTEEIAAESTARFEVEGPCEVFWFSLSLQVQAPLGADIEVERLTLKRVSS